MVANVSTCPACKSAIPDDARTLGLCPSCLLKSALGGAGGRIAEMEPPAEEELADLLPGFDQFELLGQGGMGIVFQARQKSLDRAVAVKLFGREAARDPSFAERFASEARILASLSHPHIVTAYEFGQSPRFCFLVMEYVPGQSLRERLATGPLPRREALEIARQVCAALEYAHASGIIHRDIKPENILLAATPQGSQEPLPFVKVADFGLARLITRGPSELTMTVAGGVLGTPDYMAPEQRRGGAVIDGRVDIYAIGVLLYEMLTGQLPIGHFAPPTPDARLNRIVLRCLETDPARRFASVGELRGALAELSRPSLRGPRMALLIAIEALAVVLVVLLVVTYVRSRKPTPVAGFQPATTRAATVPASSRPGGEFISAIPVSPFRSAMPPMRFGGPPGDYFARMERDFGRGRIVTVYIDDIPEEMIPQVHERLKELSGANSFASMGSKNSQTIQLAPVRDIEAFAKKIDIGKVLGVDLEKRTIDLVIIPSPPKREAGAQ